LAVTPEYLLKEAGKLNGHLAAVDIYRMNRQLLYEYLLLLLQDDYIGILQVKAGTELITDFIKEILRSSAHLPFYYDKEILKRLQLLSGKQGPEQATLLTAMKKRKSAYLLQKAFPWIVAATTLLLCIAMYLFAKKD